MRAGLELDELAKADTLALDESGRATWARRARPSARTFASSSSRAATAAARRWWRERGRPHRQGRRRTPGLWRGLCEDPRRIPGALEEGLRLDAPVQGMSRTVTRTTELGGVTLPAGARLFVVFGSANHDETVVPDPERFDPQRTQQHLSFGRGPHFCVGATLARLEGRVALERLAARLPSLRLAENGAGAYSPNIVHRGPSMLRLAWDVA